MSTSWNWLASPTPSRQPVGLRLMQLEGRDVPSTVTMSLDNDDYNDTANWAKDHPQEFAGPDGQMSLREAIREVNKKGGVLNFDVDAISLTYGKPLDAIVKKVAVTGKVAGGKPGTTIDGNGLVGGITLNGGGSIKNLVIQKFGGYGLLVTQPTTIQNNYIGTDATGLTAKANSGDGIQIDGDGSTVLNNVISGNVGNGITITGSSNNVFGNNIGVGADGTTKIPNQDGVVIGTNFLNTIGLTVGGGGESNKTSPIAFSANLDKKSKHNRIGRDDEEEEEDEEEDSKVFFLSSVNKFSNNISGNLGNGVVIRLSDSNQVVGNSIGVDGSGAVAGNGNAGILIEGGNNNTIGGTSTRARNVIGGNKNGIAITRYVDVPTNFAANGNKVLGNFIGVDANQAPAPNTAAGVDVVGPAENNVIGGTAKGAGNVLSANAFYGVSIRGNGATGNKVLGNKIGTDRAGVTAKPNGQDGVIVGFGASGNFIGGAGAASNVISGNGQHGVSLFGSGVIGNLVQGNKIGTNAAGTAALPNVKNGVAIAQTANQNLIGGKSKALRNIISGNGQHGVGVASSSGPGNIIAGNFIGLDVAGAVAIKNTKSGISIDSAAQTRVGGTTAGWRNVISGNGEMGISLIGSAGKDMGTEIFGNYIGLNAKGTAAVPNVLEGIKIDKGDNNAIGNGTSAGRNVIAGNLGDGIDVEGAASGTKIQGNYIGTSPSGKIALANGLAGVLVGSAPTGTLIGSTEKNGGNLISGNAGAGVTVHGNGAMLFRNSIGTDKSGKKPLANGGSGIHLIGDGNQVNTPATPEAFNIIAFNTGDGILVSGQGNTFSANRIFGNGGLGISIDSGKNAGVLPPVINTITKAGGFITIAGIMPGQANAIVRLELFGNPQADASGSGEGTKFLGALDAVTVNADGTFTAKFKGSVPGGFKALSLTMTIGGNTSAFSNSVTA